MSVLLTVYFSFLLFKKINETIGTNGPGASKLMKRNFWKLQIVYNIYGVHLMYFKSQQKQRNEN
jgi:hypothetical protein